MATLSFPRGTTFAVTVKLALKGGGERLLSSGETLRFGMKKSIDDTACLITKDLTSAAYNSAEHSYSFVLYPSDTENLDVGSYYYDISLQRGVDDYIPIVTTDLLELLSNVTKRSAP